MLHMLEILVWNLINKEYTETGVTERIVIPFIRNLSKSQTTHVSTSHETNSKSINLYRTNNDLTCSGRSNRVI